MENQNHDEVDVLKLLETLWQGKWKVLSFIIIPLAVLFIYQSFKTKNFTATTLIFPMSEEAAQKYEFFSLTQLSGFTSDGLHKRFIDKLQNIVLIREAIIKSSLLNIENYENEKKYIEGVSDVASRIKLKIPVVISKPLDGDYLSTHIVEAKYPTITFDYNNKIKWIETLSVLNFLANQAVKNELDVTLQTAITIKKLDLKFKKEKVQLEINNALSDFEILTEERLLFLTEQTKIARKLGIARASGAKSSSNADNMRKRMKEQEAPLDQPYYLNGYEAIEEEISIIKERKNKTGFVEGLMGKKQVARNYEQNNEIEQLEMMVNFSEMNSDNFTAGIIDYKSTRFSYEASRLLYLLIILVGAMTGALFVLLSDAFQKRKKNN